MAMELTAVRDKLAAVLAPVADDDPNVITSIVDQVDPPAIILGWSDPWLEPRTPCYMTAHLILTCVAARLVPGEGQAALEQIVSYALGRMRADSAEQWAITNSSGPRVFLIAKTNYLGCRIAAQVVVDV